MGKKIKVNFSKWRPGDQKVYISNNLRLKKIYFIRVIHDKKMFIPRSRLWDKIFTSY